MASSARPVFASDTTPSPPVDTAEIARYLAPLTTIPALSADPTEVRPAEAQVLRTIIGGVDQFVASGA